MKRFHANVGSTDAALKQRPEVFHSVGVDATVYVLNRMVNDAVSVFALQSTIPTHLIGVERRASFNVLANDGLQSFFLAIRDDLSADASTALQYSHDDNLVLSALSHPGNALRFYVLMHESRLTTDKSFVCLNLSAKLGSKVRVLQSQTILHRIRFAPKSGSCRAKR